MHVNASINCVQSAGSNRYQGAVRSHNRARCRQKQRVGEDSARSTVGIVVSCVSTGTNPTSVGRDVDFLQLQFWASNSFTRLAGESVCSGRRGACEEARSVARVHLQSPNTDRVVPSIITTLATTEEVPMGTAVLSESYKQIGSVDDLDDEKLRRGAELQGQGSGWRRTSGEQDLQSTTL